METIAVWFSCGAASAVAAKLTLEKYGSDFQVRILNSPIIEEHPDNQRFLSDVAKWLNHPIETLKSKKYPSQSCVDVWRSRKFMSGPMGAPCTIELKKEPRYQFERENKIAWHVLGFTKEEEKRHIRFITGERANVLPVLIDAKLTKQDCMDYILGAGIKLPKIYSHGFPNANCIGCVKATSPTYWNLVRKEFPSYFEERSKQSREIGAKLVRHKGKRIFLDELPINAKGRDLASYSVECGIFCEPTKEQEER